MDNYKFKLIIFVLLIVILLIGLYYSIFGYSISYLTEQEIKETRQFNENLISSFTINNIDTIYDKNNNIYFYSIPLEHENSKYILKLDLSDEYKYKVIGYKTNLITVKYDEIYKVIIFNEEYYEEINIQFTNLPLINISTDTEITESDTNSIFTYINPSNLDKIITYNSKIHIRGDTSKWYDKKSYKVEIFKSDYEEEKNINISNFYYGSSFILDAVFRDYSKIRNVLAIDLWNNFSNDFDNVDIYSEFVEVFINDEYKGLYVFTEPINRRKLNLNKNSENDSSAVIKSTSFKYPVLGKNFNNIIGDAYLGYELKYPNDDVLFKDIWNNFLNKMSIYYKYMESITYSELEKIFNITNYVDVILFNSFTNNNDNQMKKNNYFYMKSINDVIYIQPWDMEFSFGTTYSYEDLYNFKEIDDSAKITFDINHKNSKEINKLLIDRYWQLRKTILTKEYFDTLLNNYLNILNKGSALRDSNLWVEYDVEKELNEVKMWLYNRIEVYDNYIRGLYNE